MKDNNINKYLVEYTDMNGNKLYREDEVDLIRNDYNHLLISKDNEINYLKESLGYSHNEINNLRILLNTRFSTDTNNGNILNNNLQSIDKIHNETKYWTDQIKIARLEERENLIKNNKETLKENSEKELISILNMFRLIIDKELSEEDIEKIYNLKMKEYNKGDEHNDGKGSNDAL